jgi:AraC family L-rhamnose operon transcriptional activator RhaR/AraC family L-rhamnose operon regulatory protein RhaS
MSPKNTYTLKTRASGGIYSRYLFNKLNLGVKNSPIVIQRVCQTDTLFHSHDFFELVFILEGSAIHKVGRKKYEFKTGNFFLIGNRMRHAYRDCRNLKLINVLIRKSFIMKNKSVLSLCYGYEILFSHMISKKFVHPPVLVPERLEDCLYLVNRIEREQLESDATSDKMIPLIVLQLLMMTCRYSEDNSTATKNTWPGLGTIIPYMEAHCQEDIKLKKLHEIACMSKRSFIRHFKRTTGSTPMQYLQILRVSKASRLLREGNMPLSNVAGACGFKDNNYFSRIFKKCTSIPPKHFKDSISVNR